MTAQAGPAPGNVTVSVSGTNFPLSVLGQDNLWRGPITLAADTTIDVADNSRLSLLGPIDDEDNPSASGSDLIVGLAGSGTPASCSRWEQHISRHNTCSTRHSDHHDGRAPAALAVRKYKR